MHKNELVKAVAEKTGKSQREVKETLEAVLSTITETLKQGDKVTLIGFGTFSMQETKARTGRNPQTGKAIQIAAKKRARFKAGADLSHSI